MSPTIIPDESALVSTDATASNPGDLQVNRVLRRADWRFLLGTPNPEVSITDGETELCDAVQAISRRTHDGTSGDCREMCDLAVAQNPSRDRLESLMASLRPGGSCYTEWNSHRGPGPAAIRSRLRHAGFVDVICYSPRPSLTGPPQVWVPIGFPSARRWHLAESRDRCLTTSARRVAWIAADWLPLALPICAVARKRCAERVTNDRDAALDFQRELRQVVREARGDDRWNAPPWVLASPGQQSINKVLLLGIDESGEVEFVIKLPRVPAAAAGLMREALALQQVRLRCGEVRGIPEVLFAVSCTGIQAVGESAVKGVPLTRAAGRYDYSTVARQATQWQARLIHTRASQSGPCHLLEPILSFVEDALANIADAELIRITTAALRQIGSMPIAFEHRDFSPWNVLLTQDGGLAVLDWESAESDGVPALDLIYFLTYFAAAQDGPLTAAHVCATYGATRDRSTPVGRVTQECLAEYSSALGWSDSQWTALHLLCWLVHARAEHLRVERHSGELEADRVLEKSAFVALWTHEARMAARSMT